MPLYSAAIALDPSPAARIAFAVELASVDPRSAIAELQIAWNKSRRLNCPRWRAICCRGLAILFEDLGNPAVADQYRQLAISAELDIPPAADGTPLSTRLLGEIARGWLANGESKSAMHLLSAVVDSCTVDDPTDRAITASHRGLMALRCRQFEAAQQHLTRACRICQENGDWKGCGELLVNLGHVSQIRGRLDVAQRQFRASAQLFELIGERARANVASAFALEAAARERLSSTVACWN